MKYAREEAASSGALASIPKDPKESPRAQSMRPDLTSPLESLETLPTTSQDTQAKACAKKGAGRWIRKALSALRPSTPVFNSQPGSPFFARLPPELRELIWEFVLSPTYLPYESMPAHFHVYPGAVYDACTYDAVRKRDQNAHLMQISLLLTCRAIHDEALRFLYDEQPFTIALCAGFPRPYQNIKQRRSLGRPTDCKPLFAKMRSLTLVIQPGPNPSTSKFTGHISSFLSALDHGQHTNTLTLHFNFSIHTSTSRTRVPVLAAFHPLGAFYTSRPALRRPTFTIRGRREDPGTPSSRLDKYRLALSNLYLALSRGPDDLTCTLSSYILAPPTGNAALDFAGWYPGQHNRNIGPYCLRRGAWGDYGGYVAPRRRAPGPQDVRGVWLVLGAVAAPVTVPVTVGVVVPVCGVVWVVERVWRKVRKGEW